MDAVTLAADPTMTPNISMIGWLLFLVFVAGLLYMFRYMDKSING